MNKLESIKQGLELIEAELAETQQIISNKSRRVNELRKSKGILKCQLREEEAKNINVGDLFTRKNTRWYGDRKLMVCSFNIDGEKYFILTLIDEGQDMGRAWTTPSKDINKIFGHQSRHEFTKIK